MLPLGILVAHTDFPGAGDLAFNRQIALLCNSKFEIPGDRKHERQNGQRKSRGDVVLICKKRSRCERIKSLLIWKVEHVRQLIQSALEKRRAIQIGRAVQRISGDTGATSRVSRRRRSQRKHSASRRAASRGDQLNRAAAIRGRGIKRYCQQWVIIEQAESRSYHGLSVALGVPRDAEARSHVVVVARNSFLNAKRFFCRSVERIQRRKQRRDFHVVAYSVVESQVPIRAPAVLKKEPDREIIERLVRLADALNISSGNSQTVGLQAGGSEELDDLTGWQSHGVGKRAVRHRGSRKTAEIDDAAIIQLEDLRLAGTQLDQVVIPTHLEGVISADQTHMVCEFEAPLDAVHRRVRLASEVGEARNVHADIASARQLGKSKMQAAASHLCPELVEAGGAQYRVVLEDDVEVSRLIQARA